MKKTLPQGMEEMLPPRRVLTRCWRLYSWMRLI